MCHVPPREVDFMRFRDFVQLALHIDKHNEQAEKDRLEIEKMRSEAAMQRGGF